MTTPDILATLSPPPPDNSQLHQCKTPAQVSALMMLRSYQWKHASVPLAAFKVVLDQQGERGSRGLRAAVNTVRRRFFTEHMDRDAWCDPGLRIYRQHARRNKRRKIARKAAAKAAKVLLQQADGQQGGAR